MLLNRLLSPLTIGEGAGGAGGGSPTLDAIESAETTETTETTGTEETTETQETETTEAEGTEETAEGKEAATAKEGKPAKSKEPEFVPYKRFKEVVEKLRGVEEGQRTLLTTIRSMRPKVDPVDEVISRLPEGDANAIEGTEGFKQAQFKSDVKALAPLLKTLLPAIVPNLDAQNNALNYLMKNHDEVAFIVKHLIKAMPADKLPAGIRALDKIKAHRDQVLQSSRGERFLPMDNAFEEIEEQATQEFEQGRKSEEQIRKDERTRANRERENARSVSGSPGNTGGTPPRGSTSPRRRSPSDIDKGEFRLP